MCIYITCVCVCAHRGGCIIMFKASGKLSIYMDGSGTASVSESEEHAIERTAFQGCRAFRFHTLQSDKNCCHCRTGGIWFHPSKVEICNTLPRCAFPAASLEGAVLNSSGWRAPTFHNLFHDFLIFSYYRILSVNVLHMWKVPSPWQHGNEIRCFVLSAMAAMSQIQNNSK